MTDLYGFELLREGDIPELNSKGKLYRHIHSGAELLSLENDDENKTFGITFRTPPPDSTGVPHIMEHSVLNGSRKYPVKEPFIQLSKGSLNTFLNAFTFPDKTCYPVASQNLQDFYNLVDVYLDAVFYPNITPETLKQEGWHYELDSESLLKDGPLTFKGVVFNEMKGAYSSPDGVLNDHSVRQLFPDTVFSFDSGGDPEKIPDLTYAAFRKFHATYYHPANSRIYFYGDDDPTRRLQILNEYLKDFQKIKVVSAIGLQPRFSKPRKVQIPYEVSADENEQKSLLTVNWLLAESGNPELSIGLEVLNHILTGTPASPLRKTLIESGLGEDLAGGGLEVSSPEWFYSIGMKGVNGTDADRVENLILETLADLAQKGIDADTVAASLNTVEFTLRENNTGRFPRGLAAMLQALNHWLYDGDPFSALCLNAPLAAVKARVAAGEPYFETLLKDFFVANNHRVTVVLAPDPDLAQRRAAAEQARLARDRAAMSQANLERVVAETAELKRLQETPDSLEALATIPHLQLSDLDRQVRRIPVEIIQTAEKQLYHDLFTNGILYLDLGFNLHSLPQDWLPYIPLFGRALTEMGTQTQSFVQLLQRIGRTTGGIHAQTFISAAPRHSQAEAWLFLRSKAMAPQASDLLGILGDIINSARLDDRERFRQMVLEEKASLESSLVNAGHRMVNVRLRAHFSEAGWANEQTSGISYLFFLRDLVAQIDQDWLVVQNRLESIRSRLLNRRNLICNTTLDSTNWADLKARLVDFLAGIPGGAPILDSGIEAWQPPLQPVNEGLTIPSQVNFVGKAGNLYQAGYSYHGSMTAITNLLGSTYIWDKVRVQGGAYGGYCVFDPYSGVWTYLSYRDPNLQRTIENYDQTPAYLRQLTLDEAERVKAIIGAVGEQDAYLLPDAKGYTSLVRHLLGITDEWRQQLRDELLNTSQADFQALADSLEAVSRSGSVAVLGSSEAIQAANTARPGWLDVKKVL